MILSGHNVRLAPVPLYDMSGKFWGPGGPLIMGAMWSPGPRGFQAGP
jgi:hypothetical protein